MSFGGFRGRFPHKGRSGPRKPTVQNVPAQVTRAVPHKSQRAPLPPQKPVPRIPDPPHEYLLSILIPTLTTRSELLSKLLKKLEKQIRDTSPKDKPDVEVVISEDNGTEPVGSKRNALLAEAKGKFVVFVDDDDELSDDYVYHIRKAIIDHPNVDCIGMRGIMTTAGKDPKPVVYSKRYPVPSDRGGMYLRPPQHLTPIRRAIALRHRFPNVNFGEDASWANRLYPDLKSEYFVDKVLYHYQFDPTRTATQGDPHQPVESDNFSIVIPSARADNLIPCVKSILAMEPAMDPSRIIVVDDGARARAASQLKGITWIRGEKPFCFARNVNLGLKEAPGDAIILNDDTTLQTKFGMTSMSYAVRGSSGIGVCSAAINGFVGNPNQKPTAPTGIRVEPRVVAFICVYIPRAVLDDIGLLDERFVGYGFDDNDYCRRVTKSQLKIVIYDGCVVHHGDTSRTSTYRSRENVSQLFNRNKELYIKKWGDDK